MCSSSPVYSLDTGVPGPLESPAFEAPLAKANTALKKGRGKTAQAIYQAYLKQNPRSVDALVGLSHIAAQLDDFDTAKQYLDKALAVAPMQGDLVAELAHLYHLWSKNPFHPNPILERHIQDLFTQALPLAPESPKTLTYWALWQLEQDDRVSAERNLNKALAINPKFVPALQGLTQFYITVKDYPRAKDTILQAVELDGENTESYFLLSKLLGIADQLDKALYYAKESENRDYGRSPVRDQWIASLYEKMGQLSEAITYYDKLNQSFPDNTPIVLKLATLYERSNQDDKSIAFYRKAASQRPEILTAMVDSAWDFLRSEDTPRALPQLRRALRIQSDLPDALHGLATAHYLAAFNQTLNTKECSIDQQIFDVATGNNSNLDPLLAMDRIKLSLALGPKTPTIMEALTSLSESKNDLAAGEALFLLGKFPQALQRLDAVDGETPKGYLRIGDRLLLDQELVSSQAMYQRGYQLGHLAPLQSGLKQIQRKITLANTRVQEGNQLFSNKQFQSALEKYQQAQQIYAQWDIPSIRIGDTYEQLKQKANAFYAYQQATILNPRLLEAESFAKRFQKLEKIARKEQEKSLKALAKQQEEDVQEKGTSSSLSPN